MPKKPDILEKLFGSQTRVRLMRLFLLNSTDIFDAKTAAKRINQKTPSVTKELKLLLDIGFIRKGTGVVAVEDTSAHAKKKLKRVKVTGFGLERTFPYLQELAALLDSMVPRAREELVEGMRGVGKVHLLVITGLLLGRQTEDVDVFIVGDNIKKARLEKLLQKLESEIGKEILYAVMPTVEFEYRHGMYDRFLKDLFDNPHEVVIDRITPPEELEHDSVNKITRWARGL